MKKLILPLLLSFPLAAFTDKIAQPGEDRSSAIQPEGRYGTYLGCMNRLRRIASGMTLNPNTWEGKGAGPDSEPVLFFDPKQKGFYYVTSDTGTFDTVTAHQTARGQGPMYGLVFNRSAGGESLIHYFPGSGNGEGDSAITTGHPEMMDNWRRASPNIKYKLIAQPESRLSDSERIKTAFTENLVPRFATVKKHLEYAKQRDMDGARKRRTATEESRFLAQAKETFCACVKTQRLEILNAVDKAASEIGMGKDEYEKCANPMISRHLFFDWNFLSKAHAATPPSLKLAVRLEAGNLDRMKISGDVVETCVAGKGQRLEITSGKIQAGKCPPLAPAADCGPIGKDAKLCAKSETASVGLTGAGVVVVDTKTKQRQIVPADGARQLALSDTWLAVYNGKDIALYRLK